MTMPTREQIAKEINYHFPRDHMTAGWEHQAALDETADNILALFAEAVENEEP